MKVGSKVDTQCHIVPMSAALTELTFRDLLQRANLIAHLKDCINIGNIEELNIQY